MKAAQIDRFGGPEVLHIVDLPKPVIGPHQVLIRVAVCGVNFAETSLRQNKFIVTPRLPVVLGSEVAGVVEAAGERVNEFKPGDRVAAAMFAYGDRSGGYAELVAADAAYVISLPDNIPFEVAAAALTQGLTALYMTREISPQGKRILINSAGGGVGTWLVQFSRIAGAQKIIGGVGSESKFDHVLAFGADAVINYRSDGWAESLMQHTEAHGPDIVFEATGGDICARCLVLLAERGNFVVYSTRTVKEFAFGAAEVARLSMRNQSLTGFSIGRFLTPEGIRAGMMTLFKLLSEGRARVAISARYPLRQAAEAHRALESRDTVGKVLLIVDAE